VSTSLTLRLTSRGHTVNYQNSIAFSVGPLSSDSETLSEASVSRIDRISLPVLPWASRESITDLDIIKKKSVRNCVLFEWAVLGHTQVPRLMPTVLSEEHYHNGRTCEPQCNLLSDSCCYLVLSILPDDIVQQSHQEYNDWKECNARECYVVCVQWVLLKTRNQTRQS